MTPTAGLRLRVPSAIRRSMGVATFPVLVALELANAASRHREWSNEWRWTAYWSGNAATLVLPVLAGVAAMESVRYRRRAADQLLASWPARVRVQAARTAALTAWGLAAHGLGVLACTAQAVRLHGGGHPPLLPLVPAAVALAASAAIGSALGWWWPSLAAGPVLTLGWLGLWVLGASSLPALDLINVGTAGNSLLGLTTRAAYVLAQMLWWGAVAVLGFTVLVGWGRAGVWVVLPATGLVLAAGFVLTGQHERRFDVDPRPQRWVCAGSAPVVCVDPQYAHRLGEVARVSTPLVRTLAQLEPRAVIARVDQNARLVSGTRTDRGTVVVSVPPGHPVDPLETAWDLVKGGPGCLDARRDPTAALEERQRLALWLARTSFPGRALPGDPDTTLTRAQAVTLLAQMPSGC
jgi:hypothetical protein